MKSITHDYCCLVALCAAWLVLGVEGAGNVYTAFAWCITVMCVILILVWSELPKMKQTIRPQWRKQVDAALSLAQVVALFLVWGDVNRVACVVFLFHFRRCRRQGKKVRKSAASGCLAWREKTSLEV